MAKISIILNQRRKSTNLAGDIVYPIIIKVRHKESVKVIPVGFKVRTDQWDGLKVIKHPDKELINSKILNETGDINRYISECVINKIEVDVKRIGRHKSVFFTDYLETRAKAYKASGQADQSRKVGYLVNELTGLFGPLAFSEVTVEKIRRYHAFLIDDHSANTIHKRVSTLRQYFANAVNEGLYIGANPFALFKIKTVPVRKGKLTVGEIEDIEGLKLKGQVAQARDLFLFSYYCKGLRFENCVLLQRKDIRKGRIYVKINKGEKYISILIHPKLKAIIDRYEDGDYVFPFVTEDPENKRKVLNSLNVIVNKNLKIVAAAAGIEKNLSFHISRHSIAFHLKQAGVDTNAIKDVLGHSTVSITERYLQELDDTALDKEMGKVYK